MKRAIFIRILAITAATLLLSGVLSSYIISSRRQKEQIESTYAVLSAAALSSPLWDDHNAEAKALSKLCFDYRITIIMPDGTVSGDSEADYKTMENHLDRIEVQDAIKFGKFHITRNSSTLGAKLLYVAVLSPTGIVIRASAPVSGFSGGISDILPAMFTGMLFGLLVAAVISKRTANNLLIPIENATRAVHEVAEGNYSCKLPETRYDELVPLLKSVGSLSINVEKTINQITLEKDKLNFLLNSMEQGLVVLDSEGNCYHINSSAADMLGSDLSSSGKGLMYLTRNTKILAASESALSNGTTSIFDIEDSKSRILSVSVCRIESSWQQGGVIIILTDVTNTRKNEEMRREFVANASHELKTPITSIKGFAELIYSKMVTDESQKTEYLNRIMAEADRMSDLINDILRLAKLEAAESIKTNEPVDVFEVAREVSCNLAPQAAKRSVELVVQGEPCEVYSSKDDLLILLTNLMENAIKYNVEHGAVRVLVKSRGGKCHISVTDTGIGIPESDLPRIFERFYRVDKGRSREVGGTGLGLSIVKHIVAKLGGNILIKSKVANGTEIVVILDEAV